MIEIEVILSNGDRATALSPEAAIVAAKTLIRDADETRPWGIRRETASFYVDGFLVRDGVRYGSIGAGCCS